MVPDKNTDKTYHGRPCKNCGATLRHRGNRACIACSRVQSAEWRLRNAERVREYDRVYRTSPETRRQRSEQQKRKRVEDPEWYERRKAQILDRYHSLDHTAYYERLLKARRRKALKRKEKRHGPLPDEG